MQSDAGASIRSRVRRPAAVAPPSRFAAVLCDLDGTLIDSLDSVERAWARWRAEEDVPSEIPPFPHGARAGALVASVIPEARRPAAMRRLEHLEIEEASGVRAMTGAHELTRELRGGPWGIVTSATSRAARARLEAAGISEPPVFITGDDPGPGKPSAGPFLVAARALGVDAGSCLVLEDSEIGMTAALNAGCFAIQVGRDATPLHDVAIVRSPWGFVLGPVV